MKQVWQAVRRINGFLRDLLCYTLGVVLVIWLLVIFVFPAILAVWLLNLPKPTQEDY